MNKLDFEVEKMTRRWKFTFTTDVHVWEILRYASQTCPDANMTYLRRPNNILIKLISKFAAAAVAFEAISAWLFETEWWYLFYKQSFLLTISRSI